METGNGRPFVLNVLSGFPKIKPQDIFQFCAELEKRALPGLGVTFTFRVLSSDAEF